MNKKITEPENGVLTNQTDVKSAEFDKFKEILSDKLQKRKKEDIINIELLALQYKIEDYLENEDIDNKQAGDFLKQYLNVLQIKQNRFAKYLGIKPSNLSKLLKGERPINYEMALILGKIFNVNPMFWIEIQAKNELSRLKKSKRNELYKYSLKSLLNNEKADVS